MTTVKTTTALTAAGIALSALFGAAGLAAAGMAAASPSSTITVQDQGGADGAKVGTAVQGATDTDGTQGDYKTAMDGNTRAPLMDAVPQIKAGK